MERSMSDTKSVSPLGQRMIEDMAARTLNPHTQRSHISSCKLKRVLIMATSLQARAMLTLAYGCGLRAGEMVRLRAGDIDSEQIHRVSCQRL